MSKEIKVREAKCFCGDVSVKVEGDPNVTIACSCQNCQRRTGSAFGVGAYFNKDQIINSNGSPKSFTKEADSGNIIKTKFCSNCGSTLMIETELFQGMIGVPVGCFNDPGFPEPKLSAWNRSKFNWVQFPEHWHSLEKQS